MERWSDEELRTHIGQLFIVGFHGDVPSAEIKRLIKTHKVGSVIIFQRNINNGSQLAALTSELQQVAQESDHVQPLFIGIDQENGLVSRIKEPLAAQLPGQMTLAATGNTQNAFKTGSATAETLKGYGINFNYAPVADVNSETRNPVIGMRSHSDDPEVVGRMVSAQIKGLQEGGVIACAKHFPGHGDTDVDSHLDLPVIFKRKNLLDECELIPFRRAVAEGVDAVMTAHIALPNVLHQTLPDKLRNLPASLNPDIIAILREEMEYDGLVVSDCLEMAGVQRYGTEKSAVMALKAGTDCVMVCHNIAVQLGAIEAVSAAVRSGDISQERIVESVKRVRGLKSKYLTSNAIAAKDNMMKEVFERQRLVAAQIYADSSTLIRHNTSFFPLTPTLPKLVLITPVDSPVKGGAVESGDGVIKDIVSGLAYRAIIESISPSLEVIEINIRLGYSLDPVSENIIETAPGVIFASRNAYNIPWQKSFGLNLGRRLGNRLVVIATCEPYDFLHDEEAVQNYITIYEPTLPAFKAAVDVIFGLAPPKGCIPVLSSKAHHDEHIKVVSPTDENSIRLLWDIWNVLFAPKWAIELPHLLGLLNQPGCSILLHPRGFCVSYLLDDGAGKLTSVGVLPEHRNQGLGTAFVLRARREISRLGVVKSWGLGSSFPRFWPSVPFEIDAKFGKWFTHRGFRKSKFPPARDLFRSIKEGVATPATWGKVSKLDVIFKPWTKETEEETLRKQEENFGNNKAWVNVYRHLASTNQHHEVLIALDGISNQQVGWTLMASPTSSVARQFAFLPRVPSGQNTGLIACVGVDSSVRGKGVGLGLLVRAMENLRQRAVDGILIDWVVIRGFYETLGFQPIWEYEGYEWAAKLSSTHFALE